MEIVEIVSKSLLSLLVSLGTDYKRIIRKDFKKLNVYKAYILLFFFRCLLFNKQKVYEYIVNIILYHLNRSTYLSKTEFDQKNFFRQNRNHFEAKS